MLKSAVFEVIGSQRLACEGCEQRVERAIRTLEGVARVRARARRQRIEVLFDPNQVEPGAIVERLRVAGYEVTASESTPP